MDPLVRHSQGVRAEVRPNPTLGPRLVRDVLRKTENVDLYLKRIASLRQRAGDKQRDAYTVAIGQLQALDLITEEQRREALDRPRIERV